MIWHRASIGSLYDIAVNMRERDYDECSALSFTDNRHDLAEEIAKINPELAGEFSDDEQEEYKLIAHDMNHSLYWIWKLENAKFGLHINIIVLLEAL